jgi:hypothetical protein
VEMDRAGARRPRRGKDDLTESKRSVRHEKFSPRNQGISRQAIAHV